MFYDSALRGPLDSARLIHASFLLALYWRHGSGTRTLIRIWAYDLITGLCRELCRYETTLVFPIHDMFCGEGLRDIRGGLLFSFWLFWLFGYPFGLGGHNG